MVQFHSNNKMKTMLTGIIVLGVLSLVGVVVAMTYFVNTNLENHPLNKFQKPRAAVLDMLYAKYPNKYFDDTIEKNLQDVGYQVDMYKTENITVDLYEKLPTMNYKFIVFRTHGLHKGTLEESSSIFTGEVYSKDKHFPEQIARQVKKGVPYLRNEILANGGYSAFVNETYFVIGSRFIDHAMVGTFPNSTIIIGGCDSMSNNLLAKSFVSRGASAVVGWNNLVSLSDNDEGILMVIDEIILHKKSAENATKAVMINFTSNPMFPAKLEYYAKV